MKSALNAHDGSLERVFRCVQAFRQYYNGNSLLSFEMFVLVASRAPLSPIEVAKALNVTQASSSIGLDNLGSGSSHFGSTLGDPPELLSKIVHPSDARMKLAVLTPKGCRLVAEMRAALGTRSTGED